MNRIPRLTCLAVLATAIVFIPTAFAQSNANPTLPSDPSLANVDPHDPTAIQSGDFRDYRYSKPAQPQAAQASPSAAKPSAAQPYTAQPYATQPNTVQPYSAPPAASQPAVPQSMASAEPGYTPELERRPLSESIVLPTATVLRLKLVRPLSTASARPGQKFFATLTEPVTANGQTVIPAGTSVTCRVDSARSGRRIGGKPYLNIKALSAHLPSGEVLEFTASVIDTATPHRLDVDQEGRVRGSRFTKMDKVETGSLAGAGLIAGAVIAGPAGLFIGTASGAAMGLGHSLFKHHELTLPAGTELIFELDGPATIGHTQMGG
jgi:hypothetical protein